VVDALAPFGMRHADMPLTPAAVWRAMHGDPFRPDATAPAVNSSQAAMTRSRANSGARRVTGRVLPEWYAHDRAPA
jgi:hypothetical protein